MADMNYVDAGQQRIYQPIATGNGPIQPPSTVSH